MRLLAVALAFGIASCTAAPGPRDGGNDSAVADAATPDAGSEDAPTANDAAMPSDAITIDAVTIDTGTDAPTTSDAAQPDGATACVGDSMPCTLNMSCCSPGFVCRAASSTCEHCLGAFETCNADRDCCSGHCVATQCM
jgi:hypothetical protein